MTTSASREISNREFWAMRNQESGSPTHIQVRGERGAGAFFVGWAADLHGPDGKCTCCPRRKTENGDAA